MTVSRNEIANFVPDNNTIARNVLRVAGNIDTYYECYTNGDDPYEEITSPLDKILTQFHPPARALLLS